MDQESDKVAREPWTIRPYRHGDEAQVLALFKKVFGLERSLQHWRWKYRDSPWGGVQVRLAVTASGRIIGQYGGLPVQASWGGETLPLTQVIDVMADPGFRGGLTRSGIFAEMVECFIRECTGQGKAALFFGFPPIHHLRLGQRFGYTPLHRVERLVKTLEEPGLPAGWRSIVSWPWVAEEIFAFDARADRLWARCRSELSVAVIRDATYLHWRYAQHPEVRYRYLIVRRRLSDEWAGLAVVRLGGDPASAGLGQDDTAACLVDWLVPLAERGPAELLLTTCEAMGRAAGMRELHAWFRPHSAQWHFFAMRGFWPVATPVYLTAVRCIQSIDMEWARDRWYYTMGDSDLY